MKSYKDLVNDCLPHITELFPWDLLEELEQDKNLLLIDINEPREFNRAHIPGAINVPRGILESACEYDYVETVPELAGGRDREIVVICRSGYRSALAAYTMQQMGFTRVRSLKTGLRGWNDDDNTLVDKYDNKVDPDHADEYFNPPLREEQRKPK